MKKLITVLLLAFVMITGVFSGCSGGTKDETKAPADTATPAPATGAVSTAAPAATLSPTPAPTPKELVKFSLGHLNSTAHLLGFIAKEEGFFEEEGLDVELNLFASSAELVAGLESGKLNAAFIGSVPSLANISKGHELTIFGGAMTNGHGYVIKKKYTEGLTNWDITILKGRTVATIKNSIQDLELQILLKEAGLTFSDDPSKKPDVNLVYFASQTEAYNSLANNDIDASSTYSPYTSIATAAGYSVVYYCAEQDEFQNQPCCRQVALTSALKDDPALYESFERALLKAYKSSQENKDKSIQDIKQYIDIDVSQIDFEVYGGYALSNPDPDKEATLALYKQATDFGYFATFDIESHYNTDIYKSALDSLLKDNPDDAIYKSEAEHFEKHQ